MSRFQWLLYAAFGLFDRKYNKEWDRKLESLIDTASIAQIGEHSITFYTSHSDCGIVDVWVANKFYAYGHQWFQGFDDSNSFRPSFRVARKLYKLELELRK